MTTLFPTAYFGNIEYYSFLSAAEGVMIEAKEHFPKQTYRNRTLIMSANGVIPIYVPLKKSRGGKTLTDELEIDYSMDWGRKAWRALVSSYKNSAFFEHYEADFNPFFTDRYSSLLEMNTDILTTTCSILDLYIKPETTPTYLSNSELGDNTMDLREFFTPKRDSTAQFTEYYQVFADRLPFEKNLSILDLIFCEGTAAKDYLLKF